MSELPTLPAPPSGPLDTIDPIVAPGYCECQNYGAPLPDDRRDEAMCDECHEYWCGRDDDDDRRAHETAHGPELG